MYSYSIVLFSGPLKFVTEILLLSISYAPKNFCNTLKSCENLFYSLINFNNSIRVLLQSSSRIILSENISKDRRALSINFFHLHFTEKYSLNIIYIDLDEIILDSVAETLPCYMPQTNASTKPKPKIQNYQLIHVTIVYFPMINILQ